MVCGYLCASVRLLLPIARPAALKPQQRERALYSTRAAPMCTVDQYAFGFFLGIEAAGA